MRSGGGILACMAACGRLNAAVHDLILGPGFHRGERPADPESQAERFLQEHEEVR